MPFATGVTTGLVVLLCQIERYWMGERYSSTPGTNSELLNVSAVNPVVSTDVAHPYVQSPFGFDVFEKSAPRSPLD